MSSFKALDAQDISDIRNTAKQCLERGLIVASKWLSDLLLSTTPEKRKEKIIPAAIIPSMSTPARSQSPQISLQTQSLVPTQPLTQTSLDDVDSVELEFERQEEDCLVAARSCFEGRQFQRVTHHLNDCKSSKANFLKLYSRFIATEKSALGDWHKLDSDRKQPPTPINLYLGELYDLVKDSNDPWLLFLKALFLSRLSRREEAIESALLSIAGCKWNWSTWTLLGTCVGDSQELSSLLPLIPLPPDHPLVQMFQIKVLNELHSPADNELQLCERLLSLDFFPNSVWVMGLRACVLYHMHDFAQSIAQFEHILAIDPHRIDNIDIYSNMLYVTGDILKLSKLAHDFLALDKDRPEVCCLIGNHYSLRGEREKAIKYFKRATQLDRTYLSAWTLMGHEYVELKKSHAAIEAYRRAIDVNRKDYRAWYGLGQAYELLDLQLYSIHYYKRATALRPYDVRLWQAQGMCYEEIGRLQEAADCYKHALIPADPQEITINLKLAKIYRALEEHSVAVAYHRRVVEVCQANLRRIQDFSRSCIEVAEYEMHLPNGDLSLAKDYLEMVAMSNSEDVKLATDLLKQVKIMIEKKYNARLSYSDDQGTLTINPAML
ncbi:Anaphase-promoting complex subunit 8 [Psilocybe cubensis]|uniref:Anaphase-promoting complex subunit 8 n=2 Tax=Psilocybe cubensis TaxID=181762 RepID=A0ACB8H2Q7_PSICU|nr:Anaphase-promoting complex subunit 8 [Psilocybe cubensis]KAH9482283.1 Anaphase-promoting complex subunit 8 [Psilocybe cubensis]